MDTHTLDFTRMSEEDMRRHAQDLRARLEQRRSVRAFSDEPVPLEVVRDAIMAASSAPSGANKQPWTFALVTSAQVKRAIREAAEEEERAFYGGRAPQSWLDDLKHLGTDHHKPFLEQAPVLIVAFAQTQQEDGGKHYYVKESMGLACGMLIAALHMSGLATLTHTPSPMGFLSKVLKRPPHERAFLLLPVGYPAEDCEVPVLTKKSPQEVIVEY